MTFRMPDVAATRAEMLRSYREGLVALVEDGTIWISQPIPAPSETTGEVSTPATIVVSTICPRCSLAQPILVSIHPELLIDDYGAELRVKAKSKGVSHSCSQLPSPVRDTAADGQERMPWDAPEGEDEDDEEREREAAERLNAFVDADNLDAENEAEEDEAQEQADQTREFGESELAAAQPDPDGDLLPEIVPAAPPKRSRRQREAAEGGSPLFPIVKDGETLDEALARVETLDDYNRIIGTAAGQALLEALKEEGAGSRVPFPTQPEPLP